MAPTLHQEIGLRREAETPDSVSLPAVTPAFLETPLSAALPRTAAGAQRRTAVLRRAPRVDWFEIGTIGLALVCAAVSVYRLFWAI